MEEKAIETLDNLKATFAPVKNTYQVHKSSLSSLDKFAIFITKIVGTMWFVLACCVLVVIPLIVGSTLPIVQYISSGILQLILLPLIMVGQNLQGRYTEIRAQHDFDTNVKAEKEIETIILHLEKQDKVMMEILKRIEKLEK
ncbi:MAG: DUF1003 domain-containing protein [Candidatus Daviesbacteria bacterium]|nr:DUF1003 domain-containing protein [Candidatus Daviesbacteria bacterium]